MQADIQLSLFCRAGGVLCAFPLGEVIETLRPLPVEPMPDSPDVLAGIAIIRDAPVPVVSGYSLTGGEAIRPARFVVVRAGSHRVAIAMDEVLGVYSLGTDTLEPMPTLASRTTPAMSHVAAFDSGLLLVLDAARIVPAELLAQIEARNPT